MKIIGNIIYTKEDGLLHKLEWLNAADLDLTICCNMLKYYLVVMQTLGYLQLFLLQKYTM